MLCLLLNISDLPNKIHTAPANPGCLGTPVPAKKDLQAFDSIEVKD